MLHETGANERGFDMPPTKHISARREANAEAIENTVQPYHEKRKMPGKHWSEWPGNQDTEIHEGHRAKDTNTAKHPRRTAYLNKEISKRKGNRDCYATTP